MLERLDIAGMPFEALIAREWLCTNGVGGFACSTVPGLNSRKYHGLLVAAMSPPVRRMVLLSRVEEVVHYEGWPLALSCSEYPGTVYPEGYRMLRAFSAEPFPRWAYQGEGWTLQKELCLLRGRNTVCLTYTLLGGTKPITLELSPLFALRAIHELTYQWNGRLLAEPWEGGAKPQAAGGGCHHIPATNRTPEVFFAHDGAFEARANWYFNTIYRREQQRGYAGLEDLWTPGVIRQALQPGQSLHFVCSADPVPDLAQTVADCDAQNARDAEETGHRPALAGAASPTAAAVREHDDAYNALRRAAEQFVTDTTAAPAAVGDRQPAGAERGVAVVAHYPWSAPSGRWALVAFPGLFLVTGKFDQARSLLVSLASKLDRGLLPSEFPENGAEPLYHGADVSLWFASAVHQYLRYTGDEASARRHLFDALVKVVEAYRAGTAGLGVRVDADGLLSAAAPGLGVTWMDAKVGDWVLTPRQGRAVELNALWYNAVCVTAALAERFGRPDLSERLTLLARSVKAAFNERFWNESAGCCHDVVEDHGRDPAVRPNQLLALSLPYPVLAADRHAAVLEKVRAELLTPRGLRTLSPHDPGYQGRYAGHVVQRDRAYHGGSAFPWLLGPYITAYFRVNGRNDATRAEARKWIQPCLDYLRGDGLGQLCELFDGEAPHAPGGATASAPAVAELLRCYEEEILDRAPTAYPSGGPVALDPSAVIRPLPLSP